MERGSNDASAPQPRCAFHDPREVDSKYAEMLVQYEESRQNNGLHTAEDHPRKTDSDPLQEFERAKECIDLLERIWPRPANEMGALIAGAMPIDSVETGDRKSRRHLGRFEIQREIGRGGGGIVYLAIDPKLDRRVAIKVPHPEALLDDELRHRFLLEAHVAADLEHPNIVPVYEIGESGPICFIAAAYCEGPTLAKWLERRDAPVCPYAAAQLVSRLATAVHFAHHRGVLHRDIKPSNVLLEPYDKEHPILATGSLRVPDALQRFEPKLTDFGLAKSVTRETHHTRTGAVLGTLEYMAPEQADGRLEDICPATDVYALGAILYELLTGRPPFHETSRAKILHDIITEDPPHPRRLRHELDRDLAAICCRCLEKSPENRYSNAAELEKDLHAFLNGEATNARPDGLVCGTKRWAKKRPAIAALAAVSMLFLATVTGLKIRYEIDLVQAHRTTARAHERARSLEIESQDRAQYRARSRYVDLVSSAYSAWGNGEVASARELLEQARPAPGDTDERGFAWYYVRRICYGGIRQIRGHQPSAVRGSSFSPDGQRLATCGDDGSIGVWNPVTGEQLAGIGTTSDAMDSDVNFTPDGKELVSVGSNGQVRIWDAASYQLKRSVPIVANRLSCLSISKDGKTIAAAGEGSLIAIWHRERNTRQFLVVDCDGVWDIDIATDGRLAAACTDNKVRIWAPMSDTPVRVIDCASEVLSLAFSPSGRRLATGGDHVYVWDLESNELPVFLPGHENFVRSVTFSADGSLLASSGNDQVIRVWDIDAKTTLRKYYGHQRPVFDLAFSPQGYILASCDKGGTVITWDAGIPQKCVPVMTETESQGIRLAFSPTDNTLAIAASALTKWRISPNGNARLAGKCEVDLPDRLSPQSIAYSNCGRHVALVGSGTCKLFDYQCSPIEQSFNGVAIRDAVQVVFSPSDSEIVFSQGIGDGHISIVDLESRREIGSVSGYRGLAVSPDGKLLATESATNPFAIELWDLETRTSTAMQGHTGQIFSIAFSADSRKLVSGSTDGSVRVWDVEQCREIAVLRGHTETVIQVMFSPNQECVASASHDGTIRLWDVLTRRTVLTLPDVTERVASMSFSHDGQFLASASLSSKFEAHVNLWCAPRNVD